MENKLKTAEDYELEILKLKRINTALMTRVEKSTSLPGGAYSLFESNILLSKEVSSRTLDLNKLNEALEGDKNKLTQILMALPGNSVIFNEDLFIQEFFTGTSQNVFNFKIAQQVESYFSNDFNTWLRDCLALNKLIDSFESHVYKENKYFNFTFSKINENSYIIFARDITEDVNSQKVIKEQDAMIIHASRLASLGEMAGGIAHEINNPLTIIDGYAKRILKVLRHKKIETPELVNYSEKIIQTVIRIAKIVNGLKQISRNGAEDEQELILVEDLIHEALGLSNEKFRHTGVYCIVESQESWYIKCKRIQFSQVLINLLNNSFHAIKDQDEKWIKFILKKVSSDRIRIYLIDSGHGIEEIILQKIFHPFFTTKKIGEGTGLGMSISRNIVSAHNGFLDYELYEGNTSFYIEIPFVSVVIS